MNYDNLTKEQILSIHKDTLEYLKEKDEEIENLKKDLEYVMEQSYGAFTKQWCIDWNFTEIREKYNIHNKLESEE